MADVSALIPVVARAHRALAADLLAGVGLHPGQELLLMRLWERDGQTPAELARALDLRAPTMAKTLSRMETAGMIRRAPSPTDGRATIVSLTERGRALEQPVADLWRRLNALSTVQLSAAEQKQLAELLRRFAAGVAAARRST